jgi:hypothetical protein
MDAHDCADISSQVPSTGRDGEVLGRVQAVCVDHEVAVVAVHSRRLAAVAVVEELGQGLALAVVDVSHVEPGRVARNDGRIGLGHEMGARRGLEIGLCLCLWVHNLSAIGVLLPLGVVDTAHLLVVLAVGIFGVWPRAVGRIERVI